MLINTLFVNLTASKSGSPTLVGYLVINISALPQSDNSDVLLVVGLSYNLNARTDFLPRPDKHMVNWDIV